MSMRVCVSVKFALIHVLFIIEKMYFLDVIMSIRKTYFINLLKINW